MISAWAVPLGGEKCLGVRKEMWSSLEAQDTPKQDQKESTIGVTTDHTH